MTQKEFLLHYGIKGMKWGVRKDRSGGKTSSNAQKIPKHGVIIKDKTSDLTVRMKNGDTLRLNGEPTPKFAKFLARHNRSIAENIRDSEYFQISDKSGKVVGETTWTRESKDSLNVMWVGVNESARGKGYATATMKAAVKFAKQQGCNQVTLEVPGNSPDARHIYTKLGFKVVKEATAKQIKNDTVWGGLTDRKLDLGKQK